MSYELTNNRPQVREPARVQEARKMLEELSKDPDNLTAKIDMAAANIRRYARQLGYTVTAKKIDNNHSYVWIKT